MRDSFVGMNSDIHDIYSVLSFFKKFKKYKKKKKKKERERERETNFVGKMIRISIHFSPYSYNENA